MNALFVLIMVFSGGYRSGVSTVAQEFYTLEQCEYARKHIESSSGSGVYVVSQGCYFKGKPNDNE